MHGDHRAFAQWIGGGLEYSGVAVAHGSGSGVWFRDIWNVKMAPMNRWGGGYFGEVKIGKYEEQKDHSFGKRSLGFLLLFVLAAVGTLTEQQGDGVTELQKDEKNV